MDKKCTTKDCDDTAVERIYWPGLSPPPEYCTRCATRFKDIAGASWEPYAASKTRRGWVSHRTIGRVLGEDL